MAELASGEAIERRRFRLKQDWPRRLANELLVLILALMALAVIGLLVLDTAPGHRFIVDRIAQLETASGLRFRIGRIEGSIFGDDVVGALVKLAQEPRAVGEVFNIGNTEEVSIRELAERVKRITGSSSPVQLVPYDEAYEAGFEDMPRRVPDISKAGQLVGYQPRLGLDEIICRVVESYQRA